MHFCPFFLLLLIFSFGKDLFILQIRLALIQYNVGREVKHPLQCSRRNIKDQSHAARNTLKIPDMGYRCSQSDVSHTLTAHTCLCDLNPAPVADNAFIADLFILSAVTLPVLARSEDSFTEQTVLLWFQCPVVDCLRLCHFASGPLKDLFR